MFKKASTHNLKLRLALFGASGSGKTFTSLLVAQGLGDKIALIDTERGSGSKYASRMQKEYNVEYDVCTLDDFGINAYVKAINEAAKLNYDVLIIDSLTHAWKELLQVVEKLANTKFRGNTWSAWSEGTPMQQKLVDSLLNFPGHIIATMRCKTEWVVEKDEKTGKTRPNKIGLSPEQGKGIEYEFDMLMELSPEHIGRITKDRSGEFQDMIIEKPGRELGSQLKHWLALSDEKEEQSTVTPSTIVETKTIIQQCDSLRSLSDLWQTLPKSIKVELEATKNARKHDLQQKQEAA